MGAALAALLAAACGGDGAPAIDAGGSDGGSDAAAASVDAAAPDGAADAGRTSTGGAVAWSPDLPNPYILPAPGDPPDFGGIALDFFLQYTVELPVPNDPAAQLGVVICSQPAGEPEPLCDESSREAPDGAGGYRWGLDPSQYAVGFNVYTHTLTLTQGGVTLDEAVLRFEVTATH